MKGNAEQRRIVAYLDNFPLSRDLRQARLASHKGMISHRGTMSRKGTMLQSETQEELGALTSSPSKASGILSVLRPHAKRAGAFWGRKMMIASL